MARWNIFATPSNTTNQKLLEIGQFDEHFVVGSLFHVLTSTILSVPRCM